MCFWRCVAAACFDGTGRGSALDATTCSEMRCGEGVRLGNGAIPPQPTAYNSDKLQGVVATVVAMGGEELFARLDPWRRPNFEVRSEEHTSELQSLMRISYAVYCWKKK